MLSGFNHLTLAVADLHRSLAFYRDVLQLRVEAMWDNGAYLSLPGLWLCLSKDSQRKGEPGADYTHYAFSVSAADFISVVQTLKSAEVQQWHENRSEGASFYFLDPDGHKLEVHVGDLQSRLATCRHKPYPGMRFCDEP